MTRRFIVLAAITLTAWTAVGAIRTVPHWRAAELMDPGDDWTHYDEMATAVADGDLYGGPAGPKANGTLLYGYVLGALRAILGPGTYPLYFVQHVMLGCALVILAYVAEGLWGALAGVTTLAVANVWAVADVTRWYSMRLLSENLFLPAIALAWLCRTEGGRSSRAVVLDIFAPPREEYRTAGKGLGRAAPA